MCVLLNDLVLFEAICGVFFPHWNYDCLLNLIKINDFSSFQNEEDINNW